MMSSGLKKKLIERGNIYLVKSSDDSAASPALILSNDVHNRMGNSVIAVPISYNTSKVYPFEAPVLVGSREAKAMCDQIKPIQIELIGDQVGGISAKEMGTIERSLKLVLDTI